MNKKRYVSDREYHEAKSRRIEAKKETKRRTVRRKIKRWDGGD